MVGQRVFRIAVLAGDGIGPEVMSEALRVLDAVSRSWQQVKLACEAFPAGADTFRREGTPLPARTLEACRQADAVLLGAMGLPEVRWPDGREMVPQVDLREALDLYCGLRPIRLYAEQDSPLKNVRRPDLDLLIVRESTEGLFWGRHRSAAQQEDEACDIMRITRRGSERLFHAAFQWARKRRRHVTLVDKANVLPSMAFFRRIFFDVAQHYPDVTTECLYVDAAALYLVQRPARFDVLVTENMFGDILSDLAAGLIGGLGMAPSADLGDSHAVFQPVHGTAPDIAGRGVANPIAMILSAALMLQWLGHPETMEAAAKIDKAVARTLANASWRTPDLGGQLTTRQLTDRIVECLAEVE
jgi:3-isopropylmalate dehydrogenase